MSVSALSFSITMLVFIVAFCHGSDNDQPKIVCYYGSWRGSGEPDRGNPGKLYPEHIEISLCTHLLYAFATVSPNHTIKIHNEEFDVKKKGYTRVVKLKEKNPELKVLLAVGGWCEGGHDFSSMAFTNESRETFIDSVVEVLVKYEFDGIDLDWEYPVVKGLHEGKVEDKDNFSQLILDLQDKFKSLASGSGSPKMLVAAAVTPVVDKSKTAYDRKNICENLDFVNLMTYDFHGQWDFGSYGLGYQAPLYPATEKDDDVRLSIDTMVKSWLDDCDGRKLILGIALYGHSYKLKHAKDTAVRSKSTGVGTMGAYTKAAGILSHFEICERKKLGWVEQYDENAVSVYAYSESEWVSYDDSRSISEKVKYLKENELGGAMVWSIDLDDFNGAYCDQVYPLMQAINKGLNRNVTVSRPAIPVAIEKPPPLCPKNIASCEKGGDRIYYKDWCNQNKYLWCAHKDSEPVHMSCPKSLIFNQSKGVCDWPKYHFLTWKYTFRHINISLS